MRFQLAAAAACTLIVAGPAAAQSSVTISGIFDLGITYDKATNGSHVWGVNEGLDGRMKFSGVEDLGGGASAFFDLEHGFNGDTGAANSSTLFWQRTSRVGLRSNALGTLYLGWYYSPMHMVGAMADPWVFERKGNLYKYTWANAHGVLNGTASRLGTVRIANGVGYTTPKFGGFSATVAMGLGEGGTTTTAVGKRRIAGSVSYAEGPLFLNGAIDRVDSNDGAWLINGGYNFGVIKPTFNIAGSKNNGFEQRSWLVGATIPAGAGFVRTGYGAYDDKSPANLDTKRLGIGYEHFLSKRTSLYTDGFGEKVNNAPRRVYGLDWGITHRF